MPDPLKRLRDTMRRQVERHASSPCSDTPIANLSLSVVPQPGSGVATVHTPVVCLILQGAKRVTIGNTTLDYDSGSYFMASLDVPATGQIVAASPERPYLGLGLKLDRVALAELIAGLPDHAPIPAERPSFALGPVTLDLLEAWAGLLALLDCPEDIPALARTREREILYRLLRGPLGGHLRQFAQEDSRLARIRRAIGWIRDHYDQPLRTGTLAGIAAMSSASFHRHFKTATAMSPLQYQKTLRLHAARRLMVAGAEASSAAWSVGYESASQFSRDYRRAFGAPPARDAEQLRG